MILFPNIKELHHKQTNRLFFSLTRQSNELTNQSLKIAESNIRLTTEISKTAIQPFVFVDTVSEIKDFLKVGEIPSIKFRIINVGSAPAYNMDAVSAFLLEYPHTHKIVSDLIKRRVDTLAWFLGSNKTFQSTQRLGNSK